MFSDRRKRLTILAGALLALHAAWICVHLGLVSQGLINPWKLGGYGMYTVPHPLPRLHVFAIRGDTKAWAELRDGSYNSYRFDVADNNHVFRCHAPDEEAIRGFLDENPHLRRRPLTLALSEETMTRDPIGAERTIYAKTELAWTGPETVTFRTGACGETRDGHLTYTDPPA